MILPSRDLTLTGGLRCAPAVVTPAVWQEHLMKHPLGVHAIASTRGTAAWNREGWDTTTPPVVAESERADLVRAIGGLSSGKKRCEVPEIRSTGAWSDLRELACKSCPAVLATPCAQLCLEIGTRYAAVTEELLLAVVEGAGVCVTRGALSTAVFSMWRTPEKLVGLTVLTFGLEKRRRDRPLARLNRHDGVRVEMSFREPNHLSWRTTYREAAAVAASKSQILFLTDYLESADSMGPLSDLCVVARRWWESHGS